MPEDAGEAGCSRRDVNNRIFRPACLYCQSSCGEGLSSDRLLVDVLLLVEGLAQAGDREAGGL